MKCKNCGREITSPALIGVEDCDFCVLRSALIEARLHFEAAGFTHRVARIDAALSSTASGDGNAK